MVVIVLATRFVVELALFAGVAVAAGAMADTTLSRVALGALAVTPLVLFWATFLSPKARVTLPLATRVALEVGVFALVAAWLWFSDFQWFGGLLFAADLIVLIGLFAVGEQPGKPYDPGQGLNQSTGHA